MPSKHEDESADRSQTLSYQAHRVEAGSAVRQGAASLATTPYLLPAGIIPGDFRNGFTSPAPLSAGSEIGHYRILRQLGSGGMGTVYEAYHQMLHRRVALKTLVSHRLETPGTIHRFQQEMRVIGSLEHPGILGALDAGWASGTLYLATEYVDGIDLSKLVKRAGKVPAEFASEFVAQAAEALEYAHSKGVMHRDIKPANLMVSKSAGVKVLDFGLAVIGDTSADERLTEACHMLGTPDFVSPEQAVDPRSVTAATDIYSLGCTLYYLLSGQPPFHGEGGTTPTKKMLAHVTLPPPKLSAICPELPPELCMLVEAMLEKKPDDRPKSMTEVRQTLQKIDDSKMLLAWLEPFWEECAPQTFPQYNVEQETLASQDRSVSTRADYDVSESQPPTIAVTNLQQKATTAKSNQIESSSSVPLPERNRETNYLWIVAALAGFSLGMLALFALTSSSRPSETKQQADSATTIRDADGLESASHNERASNDSQRSKVEQSQITSATSLITNWTVNHFRVNQGNFYQLGQLGLQPVVEGDDLRMDFEFSESLHPYLFAVNTDSTLQLCLPEELGASQASVQELSLYYEPNAFFTLSEGPGVQTFFLLLCHQVITAPERMMEQTLPPQLRERLAGSPETASADSNFVGQGYWLYQNGLLRPINADSTNLTARERGTKTYRGPTLISEICTRLYSDFPEIKEVFALSFVVRPKDQGTDKVPRNAEDSPFVEPFQAGGFPG